MRELASTGESGVRRYGHQARAALLVLSIALIGLVIGIAVALSLTLILTWASDLDV